MISTDLLYQLSNAVFNEDADDDPDLAGTLWEHIAGLDPADAVRLTAAISELAAASAADRSQLLESIGFAWSIEGDESEFFSALAEAVAAISEEVSESVP